MSNNTELDKQDQTFTSADRIRQLSEIDKDVATLIHSAGLAIQALTNAKSDNVDSNSNSNSNPNPNPNPDSSSSAAEANSLASHKAEFQAATSQYFALLSSIDVRLRRQVYALEEASILVSESSASRAGDVAGAGGGTAANSLDISWLNSRKDTVGKDKEAELWAAAREFGQEVGKQASSSKEDISGIQRDMELD